MGSSPPAPLPPAPLTTKHGCSHLPKHYSILQAFTDGGCKHICSHACLLLQHAVSVFFPLPPLLNFPGCPFAILQYCQCHAHCARRSIGTAGFRLLLAILVPSIHCLQVPHCPNSCIVVSVHLFPTKSIQACACVRAYVCVCKGIGASAHRGISTRLLYRLSNPPTVLQFEVTICSTAQQRKHHLPPANYAKHPQSL